MVSSPKLQLPEAFLDFLNQNGLDPSLYASSQSIPRYIRLKPGCEAQLSEIEAEINCKLKEVCWLPNFYYLPPNVRIASTRAYQEGQIYGIDAASGAAVLALGISPGDHVLDLCAAPGAKLCMILDLLGCSGSVTGVDISRHRLAASRTMLQKYQLGARSRLFVADGTMFSLIPMRIPANTESLNECNNEIEENLEKFKEWTPRRPWKERKRMAKLRERNITSKAISQIQDPELIFYGIHSGVVGFSKRDVYRDVNDHDFSLYGYDKNAHTMAQLNIYRNLNNGAGQHFLAECWMLRELMT